MDLASWIAGRRYTMNLRKYINVCIIGVLCMLPNRTFASVPDSEISLGGIYFGASMQYVKSIYGAPDKKSTIYDHPLWRGEVTTWKYGDSVVVTFSDKKVITVYVSENNGFATPAGVIVGMDYTVPQKLYGAPDNHGSSYLFYARESNPYEGLSFHLHEGIITAIAIGASD